MDKNWILLQGIPAKGHLLRLDDQQLWEEPLYEFHIPCRIVEPIVAEILILPQEDGVLFRGKINGTIALPCDRCSEDALVNIKHNFDSFESFPANPYLDDGREDEDLLDIDTAVIRNAPLGRAIEINPAALAWEEFSLALPVKPLCSEDCKGICPVCGTNKNTKSCDCAEKAGDPRLAVLKTLKLHK